MNEFIKKLIGRLEELQNYACFPDDFVSEEQEKVYSHFKTKLTEILMFAEEYNNDFCEWHKVKNGNAYKCNTHAEIHDSRVLDWYVCPYCGRKIKVVE